MRMRELTAAAAQLLARVRGGADNRRRNGREGSARSTRQLVNTPEGVRYNKPGLQTHITYLARMTTRRGPEDRPRRDRALPGAQERKRRPKPMRSPESSGSGRIAVRGRRLEVGGSEVGFRKPVPRASEPPRPPHVRTSDGTIALLSVRTTRVGGCPSRRDHGADDVVAGGQRADGDARPSRRSGRRSGSRSRAAP